MSKGRQAPPMSELARPGKRALVAADMSALHGPTGGIVELPHRMFWLPNRTLDLDAPFMLQWMYEIVLREAIRQKELRTWLDGPTLCRLWARLYLPHGVRRDWEARHPSLREARLASSEQAQPNYESWLTRQQAA
jgi:hypothetical protein